MLITDHNEFLYDGPDIMHELIDVFIDGYRAWGKPLREKLLKMFSENKVDQLIAFAASVPVGPREYRHINTPANQGQIRYNSAIAILIAMLTLKKKPVFKAVSTGEDGVTSKVTLSDNTVFSITTLCEKIAGEKGKLWRLKTRIGYCLRGLGEETWIKHENTVGRADPNSWEGEITETDINVYGGPLRDIILDTLLIAGLRSLRKQEPDDSQVQVSPLIPLSESSKSPDSASWMHAIMHSYPQCIMSDLAEDPDARKWASLGMLNVTFDDLEAGNLIAFGKALKLQHMLLPENFMKPRNEGHMYAAATAIGIAIAALENSPTVTMMQTEEQTICEILLKNKMQITVLGGYHETINEFNQKFGLVKTQIVAKIPGMPDEAVFESTIGTSSIEERYNQPSFRKTTDGSPYMQFSFPSFNRAAAPFDFLLALGFNLLKM